VILDALLVILWHHVLRVPNRLYEEVSLPRGEMLFEYGLLEERCNVMNHVTKGCVVLARWGECALRASALGQKHVALKVDSRMLKPVEPLLLQLPPHLQLRCVSHALPLVNHLYSALVLLSGCLDSLLLCLIHVELEVLILTHGRLRRAYE
jgi:hypothetical protein